MAGYLNKTRYGRFRGQAKVVCFIEVLKNGFCMIIQKKVVCFWGFCFDVKLSSAVNTSKYVQFGFNGIEILKTH